MNLAAWRAARKAGVCSQPEEVLKRSIGAIYPRPRIGPVCLTRKADLFRVFCRTRNRDATFGEDLMRRHLMTAVLAGLFGVLALASDASACCHKRRCAPACPPPCPPPVVCAPCPPPPCPAPCAPRKHCCFGGLRLFGHRNHCGGC